MRYLAVLVGGLITLSSACGAKPLPAVRDGDIIFHTSRSAQSEAIQRATGSPYSHMGMILQRNGAPCVLEAVATVRCTPLGSWIAQGTGGHFVVKRLKTPPALDAQAVAALREEGERLEGRPYDSVFGWSDDRIYCSELVWKVYDRALGVHAGELQRLRDFKLEDPVVKGKLRERYGRQLPLDEPVIAPSAMFSSPLLYTVAEE